MWIATSKKELKYLNLDEIKQFEFRPSHRLGGLKINGEMFCDNLDTAKEIFNALRDYFMSVGGLKQTNIYDAIEKNNKRVLKDN